MTQTQLTFDAASEADTERLGQALAVALADGGIVALSGPLGAGKTRLVQAVAVALGADRRDVVSPTFVLVHEYCAAHPIYHIDVYRLRDDDEFMELGALEYFAAPNLVFIEWAERVERCLPPDRLQITISAPDARGRRFEFTAHGDNASAQIARLQSALARIAER